MTQVAESIEASTQRRLVPGSSGWTVDDLNEPAYEKVWGREHIELVNGIIVTLPPALFGGSGAAGNLLHLLMANVEFRSGRLLPEFDFQLATDTIFRPDLVWMSLEDVAKHKAQAVDQGRDLVRSRIAIPPTLVIELISKGYERHHRVLKFARYAEFGVPNNWIVDAFAKRFDCFVLQGKTYQLQAGGKDDEQIRPSLFAPLIISLATIWVDY